MNTTQKGTPVIGDGEKVIFIIGDEQFLITNIASIGIISVKCTTGAAITIEPKAPNSIVIKAL